MLFLHEVHKVVGAKADEFEEKYRKGWMPMLAKGDDARLLWYMNHAMGSSVSYNVVTITGIKDGAAWERMALRVQSGDLRDWVNDVDKLRYDVTGKMLLPVYWSRIQEVDFKTVPTDGREHDLSLFMEDTGWPYSSLDDYIKMWDEIYSRPMSQAPPEMRILDIQACFQVAHGSYQRREAMLWQKITSLDALMHLVTNELGPEQRKPGTYMVDALKYRDQWQSKLLRSSAWSPLF
ncbi:MAG TPA: hypothetical protein VKB84_10640 [Candidatus Binataceae bacterium]|nr:hypothetical protein [Candidatus Binataceae bacterium]